MVQLRYPDQQNVKFTWWYLAQVNKSKQKEQGREGYRAEMSDLDKTAGRLTYELDRVVLSEALRIFWIPMAEQNESV